MAAGIGVGFTRSEQDSALAQSYPISVVIPAHNAAGELRLCLQALLRNDLTAVEILVVDDASTDGTASLVSEFSERMKEAAPGAALWCLQRKERSGPAAARNEGLGQARHPYLFFLDADMVLPEKSLRWTRETLDLYRHRPDVAGVLGVYSEEIPWTDFASNYKNLYTCFLYRITETQSPFLHTPIFCVRREILESAGGFDAGLATAEDFRLGVVLGSQGYRFIIDRRIQGRHLKRYSLGGIFREDRRRIRDLRGMRLSAEQRRFYYRAHRWRRLLSVALPGAILVLGAGGWGFIALSLLALFYLLNVRFIAYFIRRRGWAFGLQSALFLFLEMLWAEVALIAGFLARAAR